jgi:hypothetical protein
LRCSPSPTAHANSIYTSFSRARSDNILNAPQLKGADARHQSRYHGLVVAHLSPAHRVAAGLHALPSLAKPFAATQAAWRFYNHDDISLVQLAQPLVDCARQGIADDCDQWLLMPMDWSNLHYAHHENKIGRVELAQSKDLGYELLTALAVSDRDGAPIAPLCLEMRAGDGVHSTRSATPLKPLSALDGLAPVMEHVEKLALGKRPVFIVDREADSIGHYRTWSREGWRYLIRADEDRLVMYDGREQQLGEVVRRLKRQGALVECRDVEFEGQLARQFVAETQVVLHRPARQHRINRRTGKAMHVNIPGVALGLRLVVSEIRNDKGKVLARWLLLTNLPMEEQAATVALWYYWRWRIESYHKLLKGAGQQVECWQQQTPDALVKRLAVAAMACVVVWRLARDQRPEAQEVREVLVTLSGRQMKRGKNARGFTEPALLAGLGVLIPMLLLLEQYDVDDLRHMVAQALPGILPFAPRIRRAAT